jgi:hypothetical protein
MVSDILEFPGIKSVCQSTNLAKLQKDCEETTYGNFLNRRCALQFCSHLIKIIVCLRSRAKLVGWLNLRPVI